MPKTEDIVWPYLENLISSNFNSKRSPSNMEVLKQYGCKAVAIKIEEGLHEERYIVDLIPRQECLSHLRRSLRILGLPAVNVPGEETSGRGHDCYKGLNLNARLDPLFGYFRLAPYGIKTTLRDLLIRRYPSSRFVKPFVQEFVKRSFAGFKKCKLLAIY